MARTKGSKNKEKRTDTKDECLYVRCTTEEKSQLTQLAEKEGLSLSKFILKKCFSEK